MISPQRIRMSSVHAPVVVLEPALESNMSPQPRKQEPWSERHRWILWASLALMGCVAGGLALRALRNGEVTSKTRAGKPAYSPADGFRAHSLTPRAQQIV